MSKKSRTISEVENDISIVIILLKRNIFDNQSEDKLNNILENLMRLNKERDNILSDKIANKLKELKNLKN